MIALLVTSALARPAAINICELGVLTRTLPSQSDTDVPVDLLPAFLWESNCGLDAPYTVSLIRDGETEPVFQEVYDFPDFTTAGAGFLLEPDWGTLEPDTAYTVSIAGSFNEMHFLGFTTGSRTVTPISGAVPQITIDYAAQSKVDRFDFPIEVEITVTSAGDDDGGVYIVRDGGVERGVILAGASPSTTTLEWWTDTWTKEICLTAVERDGTGAWHGPTDEVCAKVEGARGCAHTPPWMAPLAFLPLLGLRRRR